MPPGKSIKQGDIAIATWLVTETEDELHRIVSGIDDLPKNINRRKERLATAALLQWLGLPVSYQYDPSGRPYIPNRDVFISISHTIGLVAVASSNVHPVGIDVEQVKRDFRRVEVKYLTESEALQANSYADEHYALTWCAKEAVYKLPWPKSLVLNRDIEVDITPESFESQSFDVRVNNLGEWLTLKVFFTFIDECCLAWVVMSNTKVL